MTVPAQDPIVRYTGNGVITQFDWDWYMIDDSIIGVHINDVATRDWQLQGQSVVFDVAPGVGDEVVIFRLTKLWMPENYRAFGNFQPEKTEQSMDRAYMIAQERNGDARGSQPPNGIVGAANIYAHVNAFNVDILSEKGKDTVLPMWSPDDSVPDIPPAPDPSILWAGAPLAANTIFFSPVECQIAFELLSGQARFQINNESTYEDWLDATATPGLYWMRVTEIDFPNPNLRINSGDGFKDVGVEFKIVGVEAYVYVQAVEGVEVANILIEISKSDAVTGLPDGGWAQRYVRLEAREIG